MAIDITFVTKLGFGLLKAPPNMRDVLYLEECLLSRKLDYC